MTPLNGAGTLYVIKWKRVSSSVGASNQLIWQPFPNDFEFIDADLNAFSAQQNNGQITITTGGGPTPTPTPLSVSRHRILLPESDACSVAQCHAYPNR